MLNRIHRAHAALRVALLCGIAAALAASTFAAEPASETTARSLVLSDNAWAGSSVNVVANARQTIFTHGRTQYAAFYDRDGFMVLAQRALGSDTWQLRRTPHKGHVADAHNSISLAADGSGRLHVAWDHHGDPLHYARALATGSLELGPPEGKLEHVQPIGAAPHGFDPTSTEPFAVGAFLLAGSEVHRLASPAPPR